MVKCEGKFKRISLPQKNVKVSSSASTTLDEWTLHHKNHKKYNGKNSLWKFSSHFFFESFTSLTLERFSLWSLCRWSVKNPQRLKSDFYIQIFFAFTPIQALFLLEYHKLYSEMFTWKFSQRPDFFHLDLFFLQVHY